MKVILARTAGFCMGVKRAMELVLRAINQKPGKIYTYGPLIHNPQVLQLLEERGIGILKKGRPDSGCLVVIRAHGIPRQEKDQLKAAGCQIIDATCPRVAKVQAIIRKGAKQGYATIIVGDEDHPEGTGTHGIYRRPWPRGADFPGCGAAAGDRPGDCRGPDHPE